MSGKVIAIDLDGTLFYPKHPIRMISRKNLEFLRNRIDLGDHVVIVSGRSKFYIEKVQKKINRNIDVIACNGSFIKVGDKVLKDNCLGSTCFNAFEAVKQKFEFKASMLMSEKYEMMINASGYNRFIQKCLGFFYRYQGVYAENFTLLGDKEEEEELKYGKVYKLMILFGLGHKAKIKAIRAAQLLKEHYPEVEAAYSDQVIEITPKECSKSESLKIIRDYYGLTNDDIFVVGDSGNDIPMFDTFYENSFVMAHAGEHVRCHAKHSITRVHALEKYLK